MISRDMPGSLGPAMRFLILASLLQASISAQAAGYLDALEAEANSMDVQPDEESQVNWSHRKQGLSENLPKGMSQEEFQENLKTNYYGSYVFYDKLTDWNKKKVYETYQEGGDVEQIRMEIKSRMLK